MSAQQPLDPDHDKLAASCFDFLLIELVPAAYRMVADLHAKEEELLRQSRQTHNQHTSVSSSRAGVAAATATTAAAGAGATAGGGGGGAVGSGGGGGRKSLPDRTSQSQRSEGAASGSADKAVAGSVPETDLLPGGEGAQDDEETREAVFWRLEGLGYRVGQGLVERFSANTPRPNAPLDMIKFVCKDLWTLVFRKQIDNLKTNHRGTFVLTDNRFQPLARMSVDRRRGPRGLEEALSKAQAFLWFPCGLIRGALSGFGMNVTVQAETTDLPTAVFHIRTVGIKP